MTGNIQVATTVLGGLALFVYGMGLMSEDLTQVAGARMKADPGDAPHDMAFLTVMSAVKDVARHLANIAERIE